MEMYFLNVKRSTFKGEYKDGEGVDPPPSSTLRPPPHLPLIKLKFHNLNH